jgi:hypothetical protein
MSCMVEAQQEHRWLQQFVGDWSYEGECLMGPDKPPEAMSGTETVRSVGDLWIVREGQGTMPGGEPATMRTTVGYDLARKSYVGTWIGSMADRLWIYEGQVDETGKKLSLESDGPSFTDPNQTVRYCDAVEVVDENHHIFTASVRGDDGNWTTFMTAHYRRN